MPHRTLEVRKVAAALGAEVLGIDLAKPLSDEERAEVRRAWLEHLVLFFRDQRLDPTSFLAFARTLGEPVEYPFVRGLDGLPEVIEVKKLADERVNFGGIWHSDTSYLARPPMASLLLAHEVPPVGGDTLFANMYLAYEALSDGMKRLLAGLRAVNSSARADVSKTREDRVRSDGRSDARTEYTSEHPVVRTHPETGRKALYVNVAHTARFADMTAEESAGLLAYLYQHQVRPEHTCRFAWAPGSVALWDNRCAQHNAINDYQGFRRSMYRITLAGDVPR